MLIIKGAGYVTSKRGIGRGFALTKPPEEISIGDIVRLIEGPVDPISRHHATNQGTQRIKNRLYVLNLEE
jgi:Rrf2 family cysteine metabolism transcriptional repressor